MYVAFEEDPEKNRKRGLVVFVICVIFLFTIIKCAGQQQLPRFKTGDYWHATSLRTYTNESDTIIFGSVYYPTPYKFHQLSVVTTGVDKCVSRLILTIHYKDKTTDYISSHDFNCKGVSFFYITQTEYFHLKEREISSIDVFNNDNKHSFTVKDFDYFQYYKVVLNN